MKTWFLIYTKVRQERVAATNLIRQGYEIYLPFSKQRKTKRQKRQSVIEPLFPRYLFIRIDTGIEDLRPIRSTIGVSHLVRFGDSPAQVPQDLIDSIQANADEEGYICLDDEDFAKGERVRVAAGPLFGSQGIFLEKKASDRVVLLLDIVGRQTRTTLKATEIEKSS